MAGRNIGYLRDMLADWLLFMAFRLMDDTEEMKVLHAFMQMRGQRYRREDWKRERPV